MAATNSEYKAFWGPKNWEKQPVQMPSEFRKTPLAEAFKGFFVAAPSVFTFIQNTIGGDQITSLMLGALGGLIV